MLNVEQLNAAVKNGNTLFDTLAPDEMAIIQAYGLMCTKSLIVIGSKEGRGVTDISLNAFRNGICLGIKIAIEKGMIQNR